MKKNTLNKKERLKSRKAIEQLFRNGKTKFSPPYRVLYRISEVDAKETTSEKNLKDPEKKMEQSSFLAYAVDGPIQEKQLKMTIAVPKKKIRLAVNRNLLKRRTREIYRVRNEGLLNALQEKNLKMELLFLYQTSEILESPILKRSISFLLQKLEDEISTFN